MKDLFQTMHVHCACGWLGEYDELRKESITDNDFIYYCPECGDKLWSDLKI